MRQMIKAFFGAWGGLSGVQTSLQTFWDYAVNKKGCSPVFVAKVNGTKSC